MLYVCSDRQPLRACDASFPLFLRLRQVPPTLRDSVVGHTTHMYFVEMGMDGSL